MTVLNRDRSTGPGRRPIQTVPLKLLLMAAVTAGSIGAVGVPDASAQGFFQRIFNPEYQRQQELRLRQERLREKAKKVRVSAPRYYTYKPDAWTTVSLAELAKVKTAAVEAPAEGADVADVSAVEADVPAPVLTDFDRARPALKDLRFKALPEVADAVEAHYRESPSFIWTDKGTPNPKALDVLTALEDAAVYGLDPEDYRVAMPVAASNGAESDPGEHVPGRDAMAFEMALSAAVLTYILDAERGRVDPNRLSGYHDLPRHDVDLVAAMRDLHTRAEAAAVMVSHHPSSSHFAALKATLAELRAEDEDEGRIVIAPGTFLKTGRSSPEVKNVVAAVKKNGSAALLEKHAETLAAYGDEELYGADIAAMVKDFQKENDLSADGIVGKNTIRALVGVTNAAKIAKVQLAMERSRWLPEDLGARNVFINQPSFTATYSGPGEDPLSMRVVVGKKSNQTNFFYDKIEIVEYNPYWGVPYSIIVNEMIPKLARDPSYLDRKGYEVTTVSGRKVSSASVDWYAVAAKQQSINVRQYPGRSNALGEVKILFPNKHHIYMHDTPHKKLFNKDQRAFSHGCVRLHDPKGMAAAVLGTSKDYITAQIAQGQNRQERVEDDIPVYVAYFTAWPDVSGTVAYHPDIYDRDRHLLKALDTTDKARTAARS
ncbi:MAG: L,D-transpeptidase family protein [Roseibium sp.]|nr:L,D-transpeptidase family protein [Roseibium sp.]